MRLPWIRPFVMVFTLALPISGVAVATAHAERLGGVVMPETRTVGGTRLVLNGIGLRTYSILGIHIYVAGLYLTHPDHDAPSILASPSLKVLSIHFVHAVGVARIRRSWRRGLTSNCAPPCILSASLLHQFLDAMRPVRAGESFTFVFDRYGANVYESGRLLGRVPDEQFARLMLAVFIGRHTAHPKLKRELLGIGKTSSAR